MKKSWAWFSHLPLTQQMWGAVLFLGVAGTLLALAFFPLAPFAAPGWLWGVGTVSGVWALIMTLQNELWRRGGQRVGVILLSTGLIYAGLCVVAGSLVLLVVVNSASLHRGPWAPRLSTLTTGPLNFFGYLAGLSVVPLAAVGMVVLNRKR